MKQATTIEWLSKAIEQATKTAKFCVVGRLPNVDPGIEVEGLGVIRLPLKSAMKKEVIARCRVAPYGKGTRTLVNKEVRNTFELEPTKFRLSNDWNLAIADTLPVVAEQLGLPTDQLEAKLYRLLLYEKGGFFLKHRDSEKHDRMVASLIVVLPNRFEGGRLIVRHGAVEQAVSFDEAAAGTAPCFAAFYADCEHEVERVYSGVRLCLTYNLLVKPKRGKPPSAAKSLPPADVLANSIGTWVAKQPARPLVFALEHQYTQRGLSLDLLKGRDRQLADLIVPAADKANCLVHLSQVSRHLLQFADDGSFARSYSRGYRTFKREIEIGETYEDELSGTEWTDIRGKKQPWREIPFDLSAIVSSIPIDDWKPTSEEFEGYTGNAGNTMDRWYHRTAIVAWHRDHHFDVIASSGAAESIPAFCSMAAKLAKTPKTRLDAARANCLRFAQAIIANWPHRTIGHALSTSGGASPNDDFRDALLTLHDRDMIATFLVKIAEQDQTLRLGPFVVAAGREFGWSAFAAEMRQLIAARPDSFALPGTRVRDVEWLAAFCCERAADPAKLAVAQELCDVAVERFCEPRPPQRQHYSPYYRREPSASELSLPLLLQALAASGRDEDISRVIHFVQAAPEEFRMDECQVPCLKSLIPWSKEQFGSVHPQLASWLAAVRQHLAEATASPPSPPTNWARPARVDCTCPFCAQLSTFLADPNNEIGRIPAREDRRHHLTDIIARHQCDVEHVLERKGSPFSLVLTKTNGSFERAVKRFKANRKLLDMLPACD